MPREVKSPSARWPGVVILPDYLTTPQVVAWEAAIREAGQNIEGGAVTFIRAGFDAQVRADFLPAVCGIVQEWRLENFPASVTAETFPATPHKSAAKLLTVVIAEISAMITAEDEIPKV